MKSQGLSIDCAKTNAIRLNEEVFRTAERQVVKKQAKQRNLTKIEQLTLQRKKRVLYLSDNERVNECKNETTTKQINRHPYDAGFRKTKYVILILLLMMTYLVFRKRIQTASPLISIYTTLTLTSISTHGITQFNINLRHVFQCNRSNHLQP